MNDYGKDLRATPQWKKAVARYQKNPIERNYKALTRLFLKDKKCLGIWLTLH